MAETWPVPQAMFKPLQSIRSPNRNDLDVPVWSIPGPSPNPEFIGDLSGKPTVTDALNATRDDPTYGFNAVAHDGVGIKSRCRLSQGAVPRRIGLMGSRGVTEAIKPVYSENLWTIVPIAGHSRLDQLTSVRPPPPLLA